MTYLNTFKKQGKTPLWLPPTFSHLETLSNRGTKIRQSSWFTSRSRNSRSLDPIQRPTFDVEMEVLPKRRGGGRSPPNPLLSQVNPTANTPKTPYVTMCNFLCEPRIPSHKPRKATSALPGAPRKLPGPFRKISGPKVGLPGPATVSPWPLGPKQTERHVCTPNPPCALAWHLPKRARFLPPRHLTNLPSPRPSVEASTFPFQYHLGRGPFPRRPNFVVLIYLHVYFFDCDVCRTTCFRPGLFL